MRLEQEREACAKQFEAERKMAHYLEVKLSWRGEIA